MFSLWLYIFLNFILGDENNQEGSNDSGSLSDFHQLVLLRMLRPDRLPTAMSRYVSQYLSLRADGNLTLNQVLDMASHKHHGILVVLPSKDSALPFSVEKSPREIVSKLAEVCMNSKCSQDNELCHFKLIGHLYLVARFSCRDILGIKTRVLHLIFQQQGVGFETITVGEGKENSILDSVEVAERNNTWIMVENLHLAQNKFLKSLKFYLQRIHRTQGKSHNI